MTPARTLLVATMAVALLIAARPIAGDEQFPRGLLSGPNPRVPEQSCTIETRPLSFGIYDPLDDRDVDAMGQIIYACGRGTRASDSKAIRIEMAQGHANSFAPRHMTGPGFGDLEYNIYLDATHRMVWGTGEGPTQVYIDNNPPNNRAVVVTAYGRIFGGQDVEAGPYVDDVPVRILF